MMHSRPSTFVMNMARFMSALIGSQPVAAPKQRPRKRGTGGKGRPAHSRFNATKPQHKRTCHHRKRAKAQRRRARLRT